jgi:hypothetical protein
MKKLFLVCLMMLAGSAWAEWVIYTWNDEATFYYDPATIRKEGNMRRAWELTDLRKRGRSGEMSRRIRMEYDCKQERNRLLSISGLSEPMAGGKVLSTEGEEAQWDAIAPGTVAEIMLEIVCAK